MFKVSYFLMYSTFQGNLKSALWNDFTLPESFLLQVLLFCDRMQEP